MISRAFFFFSHKGFLFIKPILQTGWTG